MVYLRNFNNQDAEILQRYYLEDTLTSIENRINEWNTKIYEGKYFEMLAITNNDVIVGSMSLYQHTSDVVSLGPEIFTPFLRRGFAYNGMMLALQRAAAKGYRIAVAQVRKDNNASIGLHKKVGFEIDFDFVNKKGNECYYFIKAISL